MSPPKVLDVDAVVREERVVRQLVSRVGEEDVDLVGAKLLLAAGAHLLPVLEAALTQEAADGQVHGVVGGDHVDAPDVDLLLDQPVANAVVRAGVALDIALFVARQG